MKKWGYWKVLKNCIDDAQKYSSRLEWQKQSSGAYDSAKQRNWLEICCVHMKPIGSKYMRLIYAFEFPDKSVYVGLTFNSKQRKYDHLHNKLSQVFKYIKTSGLQPEFKELSDYFDKDVASKLEGYFLTQYKNGGWKILNKIKTGGLGGDTLFWTKEKCVNNAKLYKTRTEWSNKSNGAYESARNNKWLDECCKHMTGIKPKGFWTIDRCINIARSYKTKKEFRDNESGGYTIALRNGWINLIYNKENEYSTRSRK